MPERDNYQGVFESSPNVDRNELQQRIDFLNELYGTDEWLGNAYLYHTDSLTLQSKAVALDQIFGDRESWARTPSLIASSTDFIRESATTLDTIFDSQWRNMPYLAATNSEELLLRAQTLDQVFEGENWKKEEMLICITREEIELRAANADILFESEKWKERPELMLFDSTILNNRIANLSTIIGERWKSYPKLLEYPEEAINQNATRLDSLFGEYNWRRNPELLTSSSETLSAYSQEHTRVFGSNEWMASPLLATITPRTFNASFRALRSMGIEIGSGSNKNLKLLGTTLDNKRRKAAYIRRHILNHSQVHIITDPQTEGTIYERRRSMTAEERAQEEQEIAEFREFIRSNISLLAMSISAIARWGENKN